MPRITFIFADDERITCEGPPDEPILQAAKKAGIPLASDCEMGDCQTCKAQLKSGKVEIDELAFVTLEDDEIEQGAVLTCVSMAQEDVEIELPYLRSGLIPERTVSLTVTAVERLSPTTVKLCGSLPQNTPFRFHPGQYVNIKIPGGDTFRSYSMASDPALPEALEFHIRLLPDGQMSNLVRANGLAGARLEIAGPKGVFYLREGDQPVLMIAGGTGLAPMVAMLRAMKGQLRRAVLCFGVSRADDLYYLQELEVLRESLPDFSLRLAVMEPGEGWTGHTGFVTDLVRAEDVDGNTQVYLCGPPPMVTAARKLVTGYGAQEGAVFAEEFTPAT